MTVHQIDDVFTTSDEPDSWTPISLANAPDEPPIRPTLGDTRLLYPGKRHVFSGPPEAAKTVAAYAVLILIARAGQTGIVIDFEMGVSEAKTRLRELGATTDELGRILYIGPDERATPARITSLIALEPSLIVVDAAAGAYQIEGLDDNKRADVERFNGLYIGPFWRNQIATLIIDHVVKDTETRGRFVIGSERKLGSSDVHLGFDAITPISRGTSGRYKITTHKDRAGALKRGHLADLILDSDPDTHQITWTFTAAKSDTAADGYFRPTHLMEKVSVYLETQPEAVTRNTVYEAVGNKKTYVLQAIDALIREGFAAEHEGGNRARLVYTTGRRYRENDAACNPEPLPNKITGSQSQGTTETLCGSQVVPHNQAVVPGGSQVVPVSQTSSGSRWSSTDLRSVDHGTTYETTETTETQGWFNVQGELDETRDAYLDSIAPDPNDDLFT